LNSFLILASNARSYSRSIEQIVESSLLAWDPVFESFEKVLGASIFAILYPDWRKMSASLHRRRRRTTAS